MYNLCLMISRCIFNVIKTLKSTGDLNTNEKVKAALDKLSLIPTQDKTLSNERLKAFAKPVSSLVQEQLNIAMSKCLELAGKKLQGVEITVSPVKFTTNSPVIDQQQQQRKNLGDYDEDD